MDWRGATAFALAVLVGAGWAVAMIITVLNPETLTYAGRAALYGLGGSLIGGVLGWLSAGRRKDDER